MRVAAFERIFDLLAEFLRAEILRRNYSCVSECHADAHIFLRRHVVEAGHENLYAFSEGFGNKSVRTQEMLKRYIAAAKADARYMRIFCKKSDKIVVSAAAEHSAAVVGMLVEYLEYRTRVIVKTSDYSEVEAAVFVKSESAERFEKHLKLL